MSSDFEPGHVVLAVIGAGMAGRTFALASAAAGFRVILEDVMPEKLRRAEQDFASLGCEVKLVMTVEDAVRDVDLVIDFVPDELESKLEIWSLLDRMASPRTVLCTPSASLSITDLASCTYRPDRCVMVRGELGSAASVLILAAEQTSESARELGKNVFGALGYEVKSSLDPDLPMLLKNMKASRLV